MIDNLMYVKADIMDDAAVRRALMRITHEIIERNKGCDALCLVGIRRRGITLAKLIQENLRLVEGVEVPCGALDITLYRDDLTKIAESPQLGAEKLPFDITGKHVVLIDDVIYTGRTIRAAIEALFQNGRPAMVQLAVLIDRGHRELPIRPDYVGKNIPTSREEFISVHVEQFDGETAVYLCAQ